jgi:predicted alpha/beta-hydrolase family hydrolase
MSRVGHRRGVGNDVAHALLAAPFIRKITDVLARPERTTRKIANRRAEQHAYLCRRLANRRTAIGEQRLAGNEARVLRKEKGDQRGNLVRLTEPFHRNH